MAPKKKNPQQHNRRSANAADVALGKMIRLRRVEVGKSQEDLASALDLSFQQVQKYEKGTNRVGASRLQEIANALDTPIAFFHAASTTDQAEVQSLLYGDPKFALRLLRAYSKLNEIVRHNFVMLMESVASGK